MYVENGLSIRRTVQNVGNYVDMWEMAKMCLKWLKYLTNGLNLWELT